MTGKGAAEGLGVILGVLALLWGVNAFALSLFEYPAVFCLAETLATPTLREWHQVLGLCLVFYMMGAAFFQGVSSVPVNLTMLVLFYIAPEWFSILFRGEVGCG